jgi:uncharacterized protein (TIGR03083 family)
MDDIDFIAALRTDGAALAAAARRGLEATVPPCPGWTVADVVRHTGQVHRRRMMIVHDRLLEPPQAADPPAPPAGDELVDWFEQGLAALVTVLGREDPSTPVWSFHPPDQTVRFWRRRMAHETAVHRADAQAAHGPVEPVVPAELAADGIDEVLEVFLAPRSERLRIGGDGRSLHLHCTDTEGEWLLELLPDRVVVGRGHAKGDCAARGSASDLMLYLWGRGPASRLETFGDAALLSRVRELASQATG